MSALEIVLPIALVVLLLALGYLAFSLGRRHNPDGSFRVKFALRSVKDEKVHRVYPYQKLQNLASDYKRGKDPHGNTLLRVPILKNESNYGAMALVAGSYYSRVYSFQLCSEDDIKILKAGLSLALGAYPILCGRFSNENGKYEVILPAKCLLLENNGASNPEYGVPFRVYHNQNMEDAPKTQQNLPLSPKDAPKYSVLEEPTKVMQGKAPLANICLYTQRNGTATLSITMSHAVLDAVSTAKFEQLWAQQCRSLAELKCTTLDNAIPLSQITPVNRHEIPGPFQDTKEYQDAQKEFFGRVIDKGNTIEGTKFQQLMAWLLLNVILPCAKFLMDLNYVWGFDGDLHRNHVSIPASKLKQLKDQLSPAEPTSYIASQDAVVAVLVRELHRALEEKKRYKKKTIRVIFLRDVRPYLTGIVASNHAYGLGNIAYPIDIDTPHEKSLAELALILRKRLLELQAEDNQKAIRFSRMMTTVFAVRQWAMPAFVMALFGIGRVDEKLMVNNCILPGGLPDFGGSLGIPQSLTTSTGPTMLLPQNDGGCRVFVEKELRRTLTQKRLDAAFQKDKVYRAAS